LQDYARHPTIDVSTTSYAAFGRAISNSVVGVRAGLCSSPYTARSKPDDVLSSDHDAERNGQQTDQRRVSEWCV